MTLAAKLWALTRLRASLFTRHKRFAQSQLSAPAVWPFDQPLNCATLTTTHVMRRKAPITRAYHDESDQGWQFFSEHETRTKDAMLVSLNEIVQMDPSIVEIADLPSGWMAQREGPGLPWRKTLQYADATQVIVDWSKILSKDGFYNVVLPQCGAPEWHGRNLAALDDSWVAGGLNRNGPPYAFGFFGLELAPLHMIEFRDAVLEIAKESIEANGGRYLRPAETANPVNRVNAT